MSKTALKTREPAVAAKSSASPLLEGLNPAQLKAVTHGEGPLLIVAGAGTGKTAVIARRIAWLIETGRARPEEILALTFTEKAAAELEERVDRLLPIGYVDLWALTFHGFGERVLRERGIDIGLSPDAKLLNETGAWLTVRDRLKDFGLDYYKPHGDPARFIHDLLGHFSRAKDEIVSPAEYRAYAEDLPEDPPSPDRSGGAGEKKRVLEVAGAYEAYEKILLERNQLDFGALIVQTIRLFRERPAILAEFRKRFRYVLVDEFQDTNYAQYELVKLIAGKSGNLTVVGDDDQSIYKFRGASVSNILAFKDDFPDASQVFLTTNYRSRQEVLDVSYRFIRRNDPNRLEAKLKLSKRLIAERGSGAETIHAVLADADDEAAFVADEIVRLKESSPDVSWGEFAVLARANAHLKPFIEALSRRGVPYLYVASKGLYLKPVIQDAICYLKLLDNYHESPALHRVLSWPLFGVGAMDLVKLTHEAGRRNFSLYEMLRRTAALGFPEETLSRLRRVEALIEKHAERARKTSPARLLKEIFVDTGYYQELLKEETPEKLEAILCLNQFVRRIQAYEEDDPRPTLRGFIRELDWEMESGEEGSVPLDLSEGPETVKLMTVHKSKGLEFQNVFIVQMVARRFPGDHRGETIPFPEALIKETLNEGTDTHIEEERRLLYVGCTRAKDRLYLTASEDAGGTRKKKPSRFIEEIFADEESRKLFKTVIRTEKTGFHAPESEVRCQRSGVSLELPSSFSFSQLAAFEKCPLQYKFAHLLKIPTIDKGRMQAGKAVHAVLQEFIEHFKEHPDSPRALSDLHAQHETLWLGEGFEDAEERDRQHALNRTSIANAHARTLREKPTPWLQEAPFTLKIGPYAVKGMIDRVDRRADGTAAIIDYKNADGADRQLKKEQKMQLLIYQLALADVYWTRAAKLSFYYLHDDVMIDVDPSADVEETRAELEARIKEIEASDFPAKPGKFTCGFCDFRDICRFKVL